MEFWMQQKYHKYFAKGVCLMDKRMITQDMTQRFLDFLILEEKSKATQDKYLRDINAFVRFLDGRSVSKEETIAWKSKLTEMGYAVRSINSMLASVNSFFSFLSWEDCKVKNIRLQPPVYCAEQKELTKEEYLRLVEASKENQQFYLVLQTICATGIRVSELQYFTVEALRCGEITVSCKSKTRTILIPQKLKRALLQFAKSQHIQEGLIFLGRNQKALNRSCIWRKMKQLCIAAGVCKSKVFPHNLRKLFARTFYSVEKDIAKLADILGHSSINTTRIYIITTGMEHRRRIEQLGLIL